MNEFIICIWFRIFFAKWSQKCLKRVVTVDIKVLSPKIDWKSSCFQFFGVVMVSSSLIILRRRKQYWQTLREIISDKKHGMVAEDVLFLQDNVPIMQKFHVPMNKVWDLGFELAEHLSYWPDLVSCDYCLCPKLKKVWKGPRFFPVKKLWKVGSNPGKREMFRSTIGPLSKMFSLKGGLCWSKKVFKF